MGLGAKGYDLGFTVQGRQKITVKVLNIADFSRVMFASY